MSEVPKVSVTRMLVPSSTRSRLCEEKGYCFEHSEFEVSLVEHPDESISFTTDAWETDRVRKMILKYT